MLNQTTAAIRSETRRLDSHSDLAGKDGPDSSWVIAKGPEGPFLDEDGKPQRDIAQAEIHDNALTARSMALMRSHTGNPPGKWSAIPVPKPVADDPDDERFTYDPVVANLNYNALKKA